ncbi:microtubule-associated tumor suppressor 1 homolog A isoform X2 [Oryzias melastigma]|uniref:microtubule-associated tumor suppressor 1 homolog A isoform X2 n=1 Tax=Oryzias melastigma TaxID=30732 RepID=UPI000CF7DF2B|nr:microtubule-associated tumor suppressor 1 homolog A isoform X2 [Oryzias melastigma]
MSKTFSVSADELDSTASLHLGGRRFRLSSDGPCMCLSTDSNSGNSILNEGGASRSPDASKDCCFNGSSSEVNSQSDAYDQLYVASNMNQAFVFTPVNESDVKPNRTFCRGPSGMDSCSLSSGEMVMRSKSFCLQDQSLVVFSSLDGSSISPAQSGVTFSADSPTSLPEVCTKESSAHPCLGVTFIQGDDVVPQNGENIGSSLVTLPSEEGCLYATFICDTPTDVIKEVKCGETEPVPNFSLGTTPELYKTFVSSASAAQDDDGIYTSTPNQNIGNKILNDHPSLSPCTEETSSPVVQPAKRHQVFVTPRQRAAAGVTAALSRVKMMDVKSKTLRRGAPELNGQQKPLPHSFLSEVNRRAAAGLIHAKVKNTARVLSATSKTQNQTPGQVNAGVGHLGAAVRQSCKRKVVDVHNKSTTCVPDPNPTSSDGASAVQGSDGSSQSAPAPDPSALPGSPTSVASSKKIPPNGRAAARTPPRRDMSNKTAVKSGSAEGRDKAPGANTLPRSLSESSTLRPRRNKVTSLRVTTSFTLPNTEVTQVLLNDTNLSCPSQHKETEDKREVKKISLVKGQSKSMSAGAPLDPNKASSHSALSSGRARGASFSQPVPPSPRPNPLSARLKPVIHGRVEAKGSRTVPQSQQKDNSGSQKAQAAEGSHPGIKSKLNGSPNRPSVMGPPSTPVCRPPRRTPGSVKGSAERSVHNELGQRPRSTPVTGRAVSEQSPFKSAAFKDRLPSAHGKSSGPTLSGVSRPPASTTKAPDSRISPLKRNIFSRSARLTSSECVDKNKTKVDSRHQQPQSSPPNTRTGPQNVPQADVSQSKKKDENIRPPEQQQLTDSDQRFQALVIVLQKTLTERDEASRQRRELLQEQLLLRQELVSSVASCDRLEKEKEELRAGLEEALHKLQKQHQTDLLELEQKLQVFYQTEQDKVHLRYQEEADKHHTLMQQQIDELRASHEAVKLELESAHVQQLQCVHQQHEQTLEELRKTHSQELQSLDSSFKDAEVALFVQELTEEKAELVKKLEVEQQRRRELAETSQKDSHILYLEQELESLKVVLDMKTEQLHQQEKKLMEFEKLTEKNVKLDESLKKAQQENEDLKARMERHAALSRQLSTEQAVLQESLVKESKMNKRLSMENEELLWKLHNGDLSSPRQTSPSSPPPGSFCFQSPRSSGLYSSPPLSPR